MKCDTLHEKMGPKNKAGWGVDQNMAKTPEKSENICLECVGSQLSDFLNSPEKF